jgi:hypothetical protein
MPFVISVNGTHEKDAYVWCCNAIITSFFSFAFIGFSHVSRIKPAQDMVDLLFGSLYPGGARVNRGYD